MKGYIGDLYGPKTAMLISYGSSAFAYLMMGFATTVPILFFSRIPTLLQHGLLSTQIYVTEHSAPDQRAKQLGRLSLLYGVGFILGTPFLMRNNL